MTLRNYTNTSVQTTLTSGIDDTETSLTIADATGYPIVPFAIVLDPDSATSEEVMLVTATVGTSFTVTRGYDGTTGKAHSAGASVIHAAIAADFRDAQVAGSDAQVQFNDAGAFGGDAGLTYDKTIQQFVVSGQSDKATPFLVAHSDGVHASATVWTFVPDAELLYTAVSVGTAGNAITVTYANLGVDQVLTISVIGSAITVNPATDGGGIVTSTASDVLVAVNGDVSASALVVATLAPGNDGSGLIADTFGQLINGADAADVMYVDNAGRVGVMPGAQTLAEYSSDQADTYYLSIAPTITNLARYPTYQGESGLLVQMNLNDQTNIGIQNNTQVNGLQFNIDNKVAATASPGEIRGVLFTAVSRNPVGVNTLLGINGATLLGDGDAASVMSALLQTLLSGAGTVGTVTGLRAEVSGNDGAVGSLIVLHAKQITSGGTISTATGLKIDDITGTTAYAIYTNAGLNSLGDDLEFRNDSDGPILVDRTTGARWRQYMDNGIPGWELA